MAGTSTTSTKSIELPIVTINASELASVLNRHAYQPREETFLKVWQRVDNRTFCLATSLVYRENIANIIKCCLLKTDDRASKIKDALSTVLVERWDENDDSFIRVLKEIFPEEGHAEPFWILRREIIYELKSKTMKNFREKRLLNESEIKPSDIIQEIKKLSDNEQKSVSEAAKEICVKKGINNEDVLKAVESTLAKDRGTKLESKTVNVFGKEKGIEFEEVDDELEVQVMKCEGVEWILRGRADALMKGKVIEVKNRKNRFMQPIYDLIQLQAYLFLYNREDGILLERLREENKETEVKFETGFWIEDAVPGMKSFVQELLDVIKKNKEIFGDGNSPCETDSLTCKRTSETSPGNSPLKKSKPSDDNEEINGEHVACMQPNENPVDEHNESQ